MKVSITLDSTLFVLLSLTGRNYPSSPFHFHQCLAKSRYSINAYKNKSVSMSEKQVRSGAKEMGKEKEREGN